MRAANHLWRHEIAERQNIGEQPAAQDPRQTERQRDAPERLPPTAAEVGRGLGQATWNALEREIDRQDRERQKDRGQRDLDRRQIEQKQLRGLIEDAHVDQELVEEPAKAKDAADRVKLDDVAHEHRDDRDHQKRVLPPSRAAMDEIGDGVPGQHREDHDLEGEPAGGYEERRIDVPPRRGHEVEELVVVDEREIADGLGAVHMPKARDQERHQRGENEERGQKINGADRTAAQPGAQGRETGQTRGRRAPGVRDRYSVFHSSARGRSGIPGRQGQGIS